MSSHLLPPNPAGAGGADRENVSGSRPSDGRQSVARAESELEALIRERVANVFSTRQLACAEAVLSVLNRGFGGALPDALAVRLASGFSEGLGRSGCLCGALSGAVMALGLFLGRDGPGIGGGRLVKEAVAGLRREFRSVYKSTCCRILTRDQVDGSRAHRRHCAQISGETARMATRIMLASRPALIAQVDLDYLSRRDSATGAGLKILVGTLRRNGH
ncbi:MAG: C-GCAxxG-C-C family protein [Desulfobacterales bacterium]|jgi:C_GCAxxG_C_C family probable redox protein